MNNIKLDKKRASGSRDTAIVVTRMTTAYLLNFLLISQIALFIPLKIEREGGAIAPSNSSRRIWQRLPETQQEAR
jgi:hypothetical protein